MKTKTFLLVLFLLCFAGIEQMHAQNFFQDTVWMRKTDQSAGMFQVKFSNNDSIIWAMGLENGLFFDAITGEEIMRIPGTHEVLFINNDRNFIRTNTQRTKIEIYDTQTFQVIDSVENDGTVLTGSYDLTNDGKYFLATIPNGYRIWDMQTKSILKTKIYPPEPNLINLATDVVLFSCDENKFIGHLVKTYEDPFHPGDPNYFKIYGSYIVYDKNTLDSVENFFNARGFRISEHCQYIATATGDPNYGVEVYYFNTKALLWKLPINGPSLTGIEFSPDDKYLVTTSGPDANNMKIWDMLTGQSIYKYEGSSFMNFDISHDGKYIVWTSGRWIEKYYARWEGTPVKEVEGNPIIIYPNPSTGLLTLNFENPLPENTILTLSDINGIFIRNLFNGFLEPGIQNINVNVSDLANGTYFINVNNSHLSLFFKLIINK